MRRKVKYSAWAIVMTLMCFAVVGWAWWHSQDKFVPYLATSVLFIFCIFALWYMPVSVSVNDRYLSVRRPLRSYPLLLSEIKSVKLCPPTMAERRICGSGGYFGYWGWCKEPSVGKYFAYYGKASDCFLVTLKSGKQYLIGCENPDEVVTYIQKQISR